MAEVLRSRLATSATFFHFLTTCVSLLSGLVKAIRLPNEMGSDFGVYYTIAKSAGEIAPLYDIHFDHKGPALYFAIWIFSLGFPPSVLNAALVYGLLVASSTALVAWSAQLIADRDGARMALVASMAFTGFSSWQSSNASIAIFQSALIFSSFALAIRGIMRESSNYYFYAGLASAGAILTRIDGVISLVGCLTVLLISFRTNGPRQKLLFRSLSALVSGTITGLVLLLLISSNLFGFSLRALLTEAILTNFTILPVVYGSYSAISAPKGILVLLLLGGGALVIAVALISIWVGKSRSVLGGFLLFIESSLLLLVTQSDKDYHLYILVPALIVLFIQGINALCLLQSKRLFMLTILALLPSFLLSQSTDFLRERNSRYYDVISFAERLPGSSFFAFNQGWPFILRGEQPQLLFTPWLPVLGEIDSFDYYWSTSSPYLEFDYLWLNHNVYRELSSRSVEILDGASIIESPFTGLVILEFEER